MTYVSDPERIERLSAIAQAYAGWNRPVRIQSAENESLPVQLIFAFAQRKKLSPPTDRANDYLDME